MNRNNDGILLTELAKEKIDEIDSVIFDCDGVLIDVTKSYDTTINKTISYVLKEIFDISIENPLTNEMFVGLKSTRCPAARNFSTAASAIPSVTAIRAIFIPL